MEHRFHAAEGLVGVIALCSGAWLLWPDAHAQRADYHGLWQQSLASPEDGDLARPHPAAVSGPSGAVSSKLRMGEGLVLASVPIQALRLEQVKETMPEIGPPDPAAIPAPQGPAVALPESAPTLEREAPDDVAAVPPAEAADDLVEKGAPPLAPAASLARQFIDQLDARQERQLAGLTVGRPLERSTESTPNWLRLAAAPPVFDGRPQIAIVIDDLGMNRRNTDALNHLPGPLTLAFLPYAGDLEAQAGAARAAGHELMLHMPMEPQGPDWPGPNALLIDLSQDEFAARMRANFESFKGFVGLNNHMGSRLTADPQSMALVMAELKRRDLLFLDSKTTADSVGAFEARRQAVAFAQRDIFLDNELDFGHVLRQLVRTEQLARRRGVAVAIGHPHDVTIEALRRWLPGLAGRGVQLVPISTVIARETCRHDPGRLAVCTSLQDPAPTLVSSSPEERT